MAGKKDAKSGKIWALKIFLITLIVSAGISVVAELFLKDMGLVSACLVVLLLVAVGVLFDIIGVAFSSCDQTPFIAMSSRKIKKARRALKLLKKADVVSSVCNDVVGDVCGIVSGAAGAAIVVKIIASAPSSPELAISIAVSALTAAITVAGKAMGKSFALRQNVKIVEAIGAVLSFFEPEPAKKQRRKKETGE